MKGMKMPESHDIHPNVTPLIDVVMCLIIFYMLVAKIGINTGAMKEITLPGSLQGIKLTDMGNTVTLNIQRPPGLTDPPIITTLNPELGQMVNVPIQEITSQGPRSTLRDFLKGLKGQNTEFKIIIRADENLDYRFIEPVLITCAEVQPRNVNYATRQQQTAAGAATGG